VKDGSEAGAFPRLQSEADMIVKDESEAGTFPRLQSEADMIAKDGSEADGDSQDFRSK
jgi:hypothetical protein